MLTRFIPSHRSSKRLRPESALPSCFSSWLSSWCVRILDSSRISLLANSVYSSSPNRPSTYLPRSSLFLLRPRLKRQLYSIPSPTSTSSPDYSIQSFSLQQPRCSFRDMLIANSKTTKRLVISIIEVVCSIIIFIELYRQEYTFFCCTDLPYLRSDLLEIQSVSFQISCIWKD